MGKCEAGARVRGFVRNLVQVCRGLDVCGVPGARGPGTGSGRVWMRRELAIVCTMGAKGWSGFNE